MKKIVLDLDDTICFTENSDYKNSTPNYKLIKQISYYKEIGFYIIIATSRNMRTYDGNIGKINVNTLPIIIEWLDTNNVPYDEIIVAKPWCGFDGFYVDDKAIRPDEFINLDYEQIINLVKRNNNN